MSAAIPDHFADCRIDNAGTVALHAALLLRHLNTEPRPLSEAEKTCLAAAKRDITEILAREAPLWISTPAP